MSSSTTNSYIFNSKSEFIRRFGQNLEKPQGLNLTIYDEYGEKKTRFGAYTARICHSQILDECYVQFIDQLI